MAYEFKLPDLGEGLTEGEVARWLVAEGAGDRGGRPARRGADGQGDGRDPVARLRASSRGSSSRKARSSPVGHRARRDRRATDAPRTARPRQVQQPAHGAAACDSSAGRRDVCGRRRSSGGWPRARRRPRNAGRHGPAGARDRRGRALGSQSGGTGPGPWPGRRREPLRGVAAGDRRAHDAGAPRGAAGDVGRGVRLRRRRPRAARGDGARRPAHSTLPAFPELNARLEGERDRLPRPLRHRRRRPDRAGPRRPGRARLRRALDRGARRRSVRRLAETRPGRHARRPKSFAARRSRLRAPASSAACSQTPIVNYPEVAILSVGRIARAARRSRRRGRRPPDGDDRGHVRPSCRRRRPRRRVRACVIGRLERADAPAAAERPGPREGGENALAAGHTGSGDGRFSPARADVFTARRYALAHAASLGRRFTRVHVHAGSPALRHPQNWVQLAKFCAVGATGYVVNLAVYALLVQAARACTTSSPAPARSLSPSRTTTSGTGSGRSAAARPRLCQGLRFLLVSSCALGANLCAPRADRARARQDRRAGDRDPARHAAELPRQQALVVSSLALRAGTFDGGNGRFARVPSSPCGHVHSRSSSRLGSGSRGRPLAAALSPPSRSRTAAASGGRRSRPRRRRSAPGRRADPHRVDDVAHLPRRRQGGMTGSRATRRRALVNEGDLRQATADWKVQRLVGRGGEIAIGRVDDRTGMVTEAWTGPQVAWPMARGHAGAFGGNAINTLSGLARRSARCSSSVSPTSAARLRSGTSTCSSLLSLLRLTAGSSTRAGSSRASRSSTRGSLYLLGRAALDRVARSASAVRDGPVWPVWAARRRDGVPAGLPRRSQPRRLERHRRRLLGRDRRAADRERPVRRTGTSRSRTIASRALRRTGDGRQYARGSSRTAAASRRTRTATRTGRSPTRPTCPATSASAGRGRGRPRRGRASRSILFDLLCRARARARRAGASAAARLAATLAFAWAAYPFTQYVVELEHERRDPAGAPDLRLLARDSPPCARGGLSSPSRAGRSSGRSLLVAALGSRIPTPRASRAAALVFVAAFSVATLAAFSILLLEPAPARTRRRVFWHRTLRDAARARVAVLALGLAAVPRRPPRPARRSSACSRARSIAARSLVAFVPRRKSPLQLAALHRRAAARLRAGADALVLPLPGLVLPVLRLRRARPAAERCRGDRHRAPWTPRSRAGHNGLRGLGPRPSRSSRCSCSRPCGRRCTTGSTPTT